MTAASAVARGQKRAVSLMRDSCTIVVVGAPVTDVDGDVSTPESVVYAGKCKVQTFEPYEQQRDVAGQTETVQRYSLHLPFGTSVPVGAVVTMADGRLFRVNALLQKSFQTAVRLPITQITAGAV